jgi:hypothetical protein
LSKKAAPTKVPSRVLFYSNNSPKDNLNTHSEKNSMDISEMTVSLNSNDNNDYRMTTRPVGSSKHPRKISNQTSKNKQNDLLKNTIDDANEINANENESESESLVFI